MRTVAWVPAHGLLSPLRGLVDRVSARLGKQVALEIEGEDVLVDPRRAGATFANLGHLVRNALDHGLEAPDERGSKPPTGHLAIRCRDADEAWTIEVVDDGRGIDDARVVAAAVARGRLTPAEAAALDRDGRLRLILLDGVTTRDEATLESGRGVGMAALRAAVEDAHGTLAIASTPGHGTTFRLTLPKA